jgi:hypothetical protein
MTANDMADALKHPHPGVPFAQVSDDTITALETLAAIFKNKFQKPLAPELVQAPIKAAENKQPAALVQHIITSPMKHNYLTRSQSPISVNPSRNSPILPRVVTPMTPRVRREHKIFLQEICHKMTSGICKLPIRQLHWAPITGPNPKYVPSGV